MCTHVHTRRLSPSYALPACIHSQHGVSQAGSLLVICLFQQREMEANIHLPLILEAGISGCTAVVSRGGTFSKNRIKQKVYMYLSSILKKEKQVK